ncbi:MAG: zinc ribbon domain-containing protein [Candidatus Gracilibacteria bacterium]|nr:zinc ribbon domain-containing protein [Candidatus Gracilibacteria bacterium]
MKLYQFSKVYFIIKNWPKIGGNILEISKSCVLFYSNLSQVKEFAYTGIIKCSECGCSITAEQKIKYLQTKKYTYYHCTHRRDIKEKKCTQRDSIEEKELEKQIKEILDGVIIIPEFLEWALKILKEKHKTEISDSEKIYENLHKTLEEEQKKLNRLTDMLLNELISEEEFKLKKKEVKNNIVHLQSKRDSTERTSGNWIELIEKTFNFATYSQYNFNNGSIQAKKEIFNALGQNILFKDGKLSLELNNWFVPIKNNQEKLHRANCMLC